MVTEWLASICMFSKTKVVLGLFVLLFLCSVKNVSAVTLNINGYPSTISSGDAFQLTVSVSGADDGTNYLRADLFKEGTSNYFGETFNGSYWLNSSDGKNYFPIQIQNSTASATFLAKIGSPNLTDFPGSGSYKLRVRRYTASGNQASNDIGDPVTVQINYSIQTPTPSPTSTATPTVRPTPTPQPSKSPTPKPTPISTPTIRPTQTPEVLGDVATPNSSSQPQEADESETVETKKPIDKKAFVVIVASLLVGVGIVVISLAIYAMVKKMKNETS